MKYCKMLVFGLLTFSCGAFAGTARDIKIDSCGRNYKLGLIRKVCLGSLASEKRSFILLERANGRTTILEEAETVSKGFGEEEGGDVTDYVNLIQVDGDLKATGERCRAQIHRTWEYSDGNTVVTGKSPSGEEFDALVESDVSE